jgi:predicted metal-dependent hydrolase
MKKAKRISHMVRNLQIGHPAGETGDGRFAKISYDPCYLGYFKLFNDQKYYEAHDILEHLWLKSVAPEFLFFKGLIQFAGAFVHLKKQFEHPTHHVHRRRVRPAYRLFLLAHSNLNPYSPSFLNFDVSSVTNLAKTYIEQMEGTQFETNPWTPLNAPVLSPPHF